MEVDPSNRRNEEALQPHSLGELPKVQLPNLPTDLRHRQTYLQTFLFIIVIDFNINLVK